MTLSGQLSKSLKGLRDDLSLELARVTTFWNLLSGPRFDEGPARLCHSENSDKTCKKTTEEPGLNAFHFQEIN
jgi:hypothetical protein